MTAAADDWLPQTRFFRDESGALVIEQQQSDGAAIVVVIPAVNLAGFVGDVSDVCGIPSFPMGWNWGENPACGERCPDGSFVGHFVAGVASPPRHPEPIEACEMPAPSSRAMTNAEKCRAYRERKRQRDTAETAQTTPATPPNDTADTTDDTTDDTDHEKRPADGCPPSRCD
jgi:hypothetical protein